MVSPQKTNDYGSWGEEERPRACYAVRPARSLPFLYNTEKRQMKPLVDTLNQPRETMCYARERDRQTENSKRAPDSRPDVYRRLSELVQKRQHKVDTWGFRLVQNLPTESEHSHRTLSYHLDSYNRASGSRDRGAWGVKHRPPFDENAYH